MTAKKEGLIFINKKTKQLRYSVGGKDRWIQPLSIYKAGQKILKGQPLSIPTVEDRIDFELGDSTLSDNYVVLTNTLRHQKCLGLALNPAEKGEDVYVLNTGKITLYRSDALQNKGYFPNVNDNDLGKTVFVGPSNGIFTLSKEQALFDVRNIIQLGFITNTQISNPISENDYIEIEIQIQGDGRGPIDSTQFEWEFGEDCITGNDDIPLNIFAISNSQEASKFTTIINFNRPKSYTSLKNFSFPTPETFVTLPTYTNDIPPLIQDIDYSIDPIINEAYNKGWFAFYTPKKAIVFYFSETFNPPLENTRDGKKYERAAGLGKTVTAISLFNDLYDKNGNLISLKSNIGRHINQQYWINLYEEGDENNITPTTFVGIILKKLLNYVKNPNIDIIEKINKPTESTINMIYNNTNINTKLVRPGDGGQPTLSYDTQDLIQITLVAEEDGGPVEFVWSDYLDYLFKNTLIQYQGNYANAGKAIIADTRYENRANILGLYIGQEMFHQTGEKGLFINKGMVRLSEDVFVPGLDYYLGINGTLVPYADQINEYPDKIIKIGTAKSTKDFLINIESLTKNRLADLPIGALKPCIRYEKDGKTYYGIDVGYLKLDGKTTFTNISHPELYKVLKDRYGDDLNTEIISPTEIKVTLPLVTDPIFNQPYQIKATYTGNQPITYSSLYKRVVSNFDLNKGSTNSGIEDIDLTDFKFTGPQGSVTDLNVANLYVKLCVYLEDNDKNSLIEIPQGYIDIKGFVYGYIWKIQFENGRYYLIADTSKSHGIIAVDVDNETKSITPINLENKTYQIIILRPDVFEKYSDFDIEIAELTQQSIVSENLSKSLRPVSSKAVTSYVDPIKDQSNLNYTLLQNFVIPKVNDLEETINTMSMDISTRVFPPGSIYIQHPFQSPPSSLVEFKNTDWEDITNKYITDSEGNLVTTIYDFNSKIYNELNYSDKENLEFITINPFDFYKNPNYTNLNNYLFTFNYIKDNKCFFVGYDEISQKNLLYKCSIENSNYENNRDFNSVELYSQMSPIDVDSFYQVQNGSLLISDKNKNLYIIKNAINNNNYDLWFSYSTGGYLETKKFQQIDSDEYNGIYVILNDGSLKYKKINDPNTYFSSNINNNVDKIDYIGNGIYYYTRNDSLNIIREGNNLGGTTPVLIEEAGFIIERFQYIEYKNNPQNNGILYIVKRTDAGPYGVTYFLKFKKQNSSSPITLFKITNPSNQQNINKILDMLYYGNDEVLILIEYFGTSKYDNIVYKINFQTGSILPLYRLDNANPDLYKIINIVPFKYNNVFLIGYDHRDTNDKKSLVITCPIHKNGNIVTILEENDSYETIKKVNSHLLLIKRQENSNSILYLVNVLNNTKTLLLSIPLSFNSIKNFKVYGNKVFYTLTNPVLENSSYTYTLYCKNIFDTNPTNLGTPILKSNNSKEIKFFEWAGNYLYYVKENPSAITTDYIYRKKITEYNTPEEIFVNKSSIAINDLSPLFIKNNNWLIFKTTYLSTRLYVKNIYSPYEEYLILDTSYGSNSFIVKDTEIESDYIFIRGLSNPITNQNYLKNIFDTKNIFNSFGQQIKFRKNTTSYFDTPNISKTFPVFLKEKNDDLKINLLGLVVPNSNLINNDYILKFESLTPFNNSETDYIPIESFIKSYIKNTNNSIDTNIKFTYNSFAIPNIIPLNENLLLIKLQLNVSNVTPNQNETYRYIWVLKTIDGDGNIIYSNTYNAVEFNYCLEERNKKVKYECPTIIIGNKYYKHRIWRRKKDLYNTLL